MPAIKHCGHYRATDTFWLVSDEEIYQYQLLLSATCPDCDQLVLEYIGILPGLAHGAQKRIKAKGHDAWIKRTDIASGDIAMSLDSSQWKSKKADVHWVQSSQHEYPFLSIKVRVK
jgi:hypothetical protein